MKKIFIVITLCVAAVMSLQADRITSTAIACPDMEAFRKIKAFDNEQGNKELYIMQQGCSVLTPNDKIHVIDPEQTVHGRFYRIQLERTNEILYIKKNYVKVEQSGSGNIFKF